MFAGGRRLIDFFAEQLTELRVERVAQQRCGPDGSDSSSGLSTSVLLEQITDAEATAVLARHIDRIAR